MFRQRVLLYFSVVAALLIAATVAGQAALVTRVLEHSRQADLRLASGVADHVADSLSTPLRQLGELLAALPPGLEPAAVRRVLDQPRDALLEPGELFVVGANAWALGAEGSRAGLPPRALLLPALRRARAAGTPLVTAQWRGLDGHPRVSLVAVAPGGGPDATAAVASIRLDGDEFLDHFGFMVNDPAARLQLLDEQGVALFSTRLDERYRSAVHGTYLLDSLQQETGPRHLACHGCHVDPASGETERRDELATVAPVPGTTWAVLVREDASTYPAALAEMTANLVVLLSLVIGSLGGFFWLLNRRVLRPMQQLARAATVISAVTPGARPPGAALEDPELERAAAVALQPVSGAVPAELPRRDTLEWAAVPVSRPEAVREALWRCLGPAVDGFRRVEVVAALVVEIWGDAIGEPLVAGTPAGRAATLATALRGVEVGHAPVTPKQLIARGVAVEPLRGIAALRRVELRLSAGLRGAVWFAGHDAEAVAHLQAIGVLIALHLQTSLERALLTLRLEEEFRQKGHILAHLVEAEAEERKRIARDIHDDTAQALAALALVLEAFPLQAPPAAQAEFVHTAQERVRRIIDSTDRIMKRLRPALLDDLGLVDAVRRLGEDVLGSEGISFELEAEEAIEAAPELEDVAFRVFLEATQNVVRHADATQVKARLAVREGRLEASIDDDGRGFPTAGASDEARRPRFGLLGMRERVALLGGQLRLATSALGGLQVAISVPFRGRARLTAFPTESRHEHQGPVG